MPEYVIPAVYVSDVETRHTIGALPTSTTAVVGPADDGPLHQPVRVTGLSEFQAAFGDAGSPLADAISDFFGNGGRVALATRADDAAAALSVLAAPVPDEPFQLLVLCPELVGPGVLAHAHQLCEARRAFLLTDSPDGRLPDGLGRNAAAYFPRFLSASDAPRPCAPALAGILTRTDDAFGVWKSPAGPEARVVDATGLVTPVTERELEDLAAQRVNGLRTLPPGGAVVVWGARTAAPEPEWKYVPVRRTALFVENSLEAGLRWTVFEPNDEALWTRVRAETDRFLASLWRQGAFRGAKPEEGYFVRCDRSMMTQHDIHSGRLVVLVGFAPLRPGEFVVLRIVQRTADSVGP